MNDFPDFRSFDYEVVDSLHNNIQGGRVTYKAIDLKSKKPVVIKQFRFATTSDWDSYKLIEREIEVLRGLQHRGIPKYLTKFDPGDGLCLVQEYKNADPLSKKRSFSPEEIKSIASQVLEILVYLQTQIPIIIHRDLKPDNILVDDDINVYLIDFGLARIGNHTMALSTMMGGTFGFMPPEQQYNQKLTEASDLYGLGATLICLITQTKSSDIGNLVNFSTNRIDFKDKVPKFSFRFIQWLEKMVEPDPVSRFSDAQTALDALQPLYVIRIPDVSLDKQELRFVADKVGQRLSQTITLKNTVSETLLQGKWSVSPHPNDPPHTPDHHAWILITPQQFEVHYQQEVTCTITIDTNKLKADKYYEREIILESNGKEENISLNVSVQTAKIKFDVVFPPYIYLISIILFFTLFPVALSAFYGWMINVYQSSLVGLCLEILYFIVYSSFSAFFVSIYLQWTIWYLVFDSHEADFWTGMEVFSGVISPLIFLLISIRNDLWGINLHSWGNIWEDILFSFTLMIFVFSGMFFSFNFGFLLPSIINYVLKRLNPDFLREYNESRYKRYSQKPSFHKFQFYKKGVKEKWKRVMFTLFTSVLGISTGIGSFIGFNSYLLSASILSSVSLGGLCLDPPLRLQQLKAQYRKQESQKLIEP